MGLELGRVWVTVGANYNELRTGFAGAKRETSSYFQTVGTGIKEVVSRFGMLSKGVAFFYLARQGEMFNRSMNNSLAIMGELTNFMEEDLRSAAIESARVTQFTATQSAKAFFYLASAGLNAQQSIKALPAVATFAQAGMFDLATATTLAADAQAAMGMKADDATENLKNLVRVTDVLTKANTLSNATVEQFSAALTNKAGASARQAGVSIEEATAALAVLAMQGIKGEQAGMALAIVLRDLQTKAIKNAAAFKQYNVAVYDAEGNFRHMPDIIKDMENAFGHLSAEQKRATLMQMGFADRSLTFLYMMLGNSDKMREFYDKLLKSQGMTAEVADKQLTAFQKGWAYVTAEITRFASRIMDVLGPIARVIMTVFGTALRIINGVTGAFVFFNNITFGIIPTLLKVLVIWKLLNMAMVFYKANIASLVPKLLYVSGIWGLWNKIIALYNVHIRRATTVTILYAGAVNKAGALVPVAMNKMSWSLFGFAGAIRAAIKWVWMLGKSLFVFAKAHPFLMLIAAIPLIIKGFQALFSWLSKVMKNNEDWKKGIKSLSEGWEHFKIAMGNVLKILKLWFEEFLYALMSIFTKFMNFLTGNWDKFKDDTKESFGEIVKEFGNAMNEMAIATRLFSDLWFDVWDAGVANVKASLSYIGDLFVNAGKGLGEALTLGLWNALEGDDNLGMMLNPSDRTKKLNRELKTKTDELAKNMEKTRMQYGLDDKDKGKGKGGVSFEEGTRIGFVELGDKIQDSLLKKEDLDKERNESLKKSVKTQVAMVDKLTSMETYLKKGRFGAVLT